MKPSDANEEMKRRDFDKTFEPELKKELIEGMVRCVKDMRAMSALLSDEVPEEVLKTRIVNAMAELMGKAPGDELHIFVDRIFEMD